MSTGGKKTNSKSNINNVSVPGKTCLGSGPPFAGGGPRGGGPRDTPGGGGPGNLVPCGDE